MTVMINRAYALLAATALVALPGAALAKDPVAAQANKVAEKAQDLQSATNKLDSAIANSQANNADNANAAYATNDRGGDNDGDRHHDGDRDHGYGKWGLLGLLGLGGLLGLKRRDDDRHDHVRVDRRRDDLDRTTARTDTRPDTGLGTDPGDTRL